MERNCKRNKKIEKGIFSPGWLYQPGLEVVALELSLEPPLVLVGISNQDKKAPIQSLDGPGLKGGPLVLDWQSRLGNRD
jgi:hypothetical protein